MGVLKAILISCLVLGWASAAAVEIEKGWLTLQVKTGDNTEEHKVEYSGRVREEVSLTQSSKIDIQAKMTFSVDGFVPEFFSFRLRHAQYDNLTEPVLAAWDYENGHFNALVDLGDSKQIKHMSGHYKLELIISDDRLEKQVRRQIANCQVNFRYSLDQPPSYELYYTVPSIIMTEAPAQRVDPPALFTGFVCVVLLVLFGIFLMGLNHQKANFNLFPSGGIGSLTNLIFLGCLGLVLLWLIKFWISWTFLDTVQYFFIAGTSGITQVLPFSLAANYAFIHIKRS